MLTQSKGKAVSFAASSCVLILVLLLVACSGKSPSSANLGSNPTGNQIEAGATPRPNPGDITKSIEGLSVTVLGDSFTLGGSIDDITLQTAGDGDELALQIGVSGAQDLKALYCEVQYDPALLDPQSAEPTDKLGQPFNVSDAGPGAARTRLLHLAVLDTPGAVHFGEVLERPQDQRGFSGDAVLAELRFARQPFSAPAGRGASAAPATDASQSPFNYNSSLGLTEWLYANQGDYDQNSETNIADLTPLALHMGETGSPDNDGKFFVTDERSLIDGDGNGEINVADITPIGLNYGSSVAGYNLYAGSEDDYPGTNDADSSIAASDAIMFSDGGFNDGETRLHFSLDVTPGAPETVYWVRPYAGESGDAGYEGTPSEKDGDMLVVVAPNVKVIDGSAEDTEVQSEFTYVSDDGVNFIVNDPPEGDSIYVDDIIVGFYYDGAKRDGGFLRRVTGVTDMGGGQLELATSDDAHLSDVFIKGSPILPPMNFDGATLTDYTGSLPAGGPAGKGTSGVVVTKGVSDLGFNYDGTTLINEQSGDSFIKVYLPQAHLNFNPDVNLDWDVSYWPPGLNYFIFDITGELDSAVEISVNGKWQGTFEPKEVNLAEWKDKISITVYGIPVWFDVRATLWGGLKGEANADFYMRTGYEYQRSGRIGVEYKDDWHTIAEFPEPITNTIGPDVRVSGSADMSFWIRPEFHVDVYSRVGASVDIKPELKGHVDGSYDLSQGPYCVHWNLRGALGSDLNLSADFGFWDDSWKFDLFDSIFDIANGQIGCEEGPQPPVADFWTTFTPGGGPLDVRMSAEYIAPDPPSPAQGSYDPDGFDTSYPAGIKTYIWDLHNDNSIDGYGSDPTIDYSFADYYQPIDVTLTVIDEEGMVSSVTKSVQAVEPIP